MADGEFAREKDVGEFSAAVAAPCVFTFERHLVEFNALGGREVVAHAAEGDDADVCGREFGGSEERGEEEFGEQRVAHVVCAELDFVAFFGGAVGGCHYPGVVDEDVEARFAGRKG